MPQITANAGLFRDWEGVSGACAKNATLLPKSEAIRPELDAITAQVKNLKLRNQAKVELGSKSEHLVQFGIALIRKPHRKAAPIKKPPAVTTKPAA